MKPADYRRLVAANMTPDQIAVVMEMLEERDEERKAGQRARWRKHQQTKVNANVSQRELTLANVPHGGDARVEDITSNSEIEPQKEEKKESALSREFASFWTEFPNKVGKPKAQASFVSARKRASFDAIMHGLRRYIASKPADRAWLNPTTFLNQDRWDDQPATVIPMARGSPRGVEELIDSLVTQMDNADARPPTETQGYQAAALRLPAYSR